MIKRLFYLPFRSEMSKHDKNSCAFYLSFNSDKIFKLDLT